MSAAATNSLGGLPEQGRLAECALPRLLLTLYQKQFDGCLALGSGRQQKRLTLERGAPVLAESSLASEALGSQLVDKGVLEREDHVRVSEYMTKKGCREGVALLALQLIGPKELFLALKDQVRRRVVDCFGWPDGEFSIETGDARGEDAQAFRCDPVSLVQEGLETHWSIERMLVDLTPSLEKFPIPRKSFAKVMRRLHLEADHASRLGALDGRQSFGVALGPLLGAPKAVAAVWIVDALHCIDYHDAPAVDDDVTAAFDSEIEIAIGAGQPDRDDATTVNSGEQPAARRRAAVPVSPAVRSDGAAERAQIEKLLASMGDLDHYEVLGVPHDAASGVIKKAYFKAAKLYHPDSLAKLGLEDIRDDASDVFARIGEAFEVLSDPQRRKDYDAQLRGELTEKDMARLGQAETSYRKGEILLRMGDFAGALEYLQPAVDLWPEEAAYQSALGWALFKQPTTDPSGARAHLLQAVRLGPEDATAHMRLGMVLRELGQHAEAEKVVAIARRLNPAAG